MTSIGHRGPWTRGLSGTVLAILAMGGCSGAGIPGASSTNAVGGSGQPDGSAGAGPDDTEAKLRGLALPAKTAPLPDITNAYATDEAAAELGKMFFYDPRFSGPLLAHDNTGGVGTLGKQGEVGKVACSSCHVPEHGYVDTRSTRGQLSLASGWTRRRTPSLLDIAQATFQTWGGRRDTAYSVVFGVIESPLEFNSSRLFVAQQVARYYREAYEAVFGPLPSLAQFSDLPAENAGCITMPEDPVTQGCPKPGADNSEVTRVVVNLGKAISAYLSQLTCGPSRFDGWISGDKTALTDDEIAGATLFVNEGKCIECHSGPYFSDQKFHNVGVPGSLSPFTGIDTGADRGAAVGLAQVKEDWLNSRGPFSDGDDGRLDLIPEDASSLEGAFRTPTLRCGGRRPSYFHNGEFRSLYDVVDHFIHGGSGKLGLVGVSELKPLSLGSGERDQLVAFLRALDGPGPDAGVLAVPQLPNLGVGGARPEP